MATVHYNNYCTIAMVLYTHHCTILPLVDDGVDFSLPTRVFNCHCILFFLKVLH